jgi:phosphoribosylanthranilate isomerase
MADGLSSGEGQGYQLHEREKEAQVTALQQENWKMLARLQVSRASNELEEELESARRLVADRRAVMKVRAQTHHKEAAMEQLFQSS